MAPFTRSTMPPPGLLIRQAANSLWLTQFQLATKQCMSIILATFHRPKLSLRGAL